MQLILVIGAVVAAIVLIRIWTAALNTKTVEEQSLASVEVNHPYLPKAGAIAASIVVAGILFFLSLKYGTNTSLASLSGSAAFIRTAIIFVGIIIFGLFDQRRWQGARDRYKYLYAFVLGTLVTWVLIAFKRAFFETGIGSDPFLMALGITCVIIGWKFLFGPWSASIKATVLGSFLLWVAYAILRYKSQSELIATSIAALVALVPVGIWCTLFLKYHKERRSVVLLAFFAGMISTVPILFYSELTQRGIELNFFLFKITPVSFGTSSQDFVSQSIFKGVTGTQSIVLVTLVTYLVVGCIEEFSKYWVLRHSSKEFFRSIDDALQLAIIVALGFSFAENIVNPTYFVGFVQNYLMLPQTPQWGAFIGSVVGRGVLTTMVHILSTGVCGYFVGLAFFASPLMRDRFMKGKVHPVVQSIHRMLALKTEHVFANMHILYGLGCAILLHGCFDFIVSLPDVLPGNPSTVGQLIGSPSTSFLNSLSITVPPAVLYVVGGFWLLTYLFDRKEDMKEYGQVVETQAYVA